MKEENPFFNKILTEDDWGFLPLYKLALLENFLLKTVHDINNAMSVVMLETESIENQILHKKLLQIKQMIRSLQNAALNSKELT